MSQLPSRRDRHAKTTIIRRHVVRKNADLHGGGAWKVAFADFTLAMMALFMTLWIINSVSKKERQEIVAALHGQSIFDGGGIAPLNALGKSHVAANSAAKRQPPDKQDQNARPPVHPAPTPQQNPADAALKLDKDNARQALAANDQLVAVKEKSARELGELAATINQVAAQAHMQANMQIEIVPQGLRVLIKDDKNRSMFERGSARMMPFFKQLLIELAPVLDSLNNKIIITGHTDAVRYKTTDLYNNWNLSGDRALSARRVLEQAGMPQDKVMEVSAMADQMLLDAADPQGAENRRIEIMVLTHSASDSLYQFFGAHGENVVRPLVNKVEQEKMRPPAAKNGGKSPATAQRQ